MQSGGCSDRCSNAPSSDARAWWGSIRSLSNPGPADAGLPSQQGMAFEPIPNAPTGRLRILDTYVTWQAMPALSFAAESDLVFDRLYTYSLVQRTQGGAMYGRYQITPRIAVALRGEYMEDRRGLFSGVPQFLKDHQDTATIGVVWWLGQKTGTW
jgi:hypothetical protein